MTSTTVDITQFRASDTAKVKLKHGDGSPLKVAGVQLTATIYGPGSQVWQDAQAELSRRRQARIDDADGSVAAIMAGGEDDQNEFLADVTISFDGWEYPVEGRKPKREQFLACYKDKQLGYLRDQIFAEANRWSAFTKGSAES